MRARLATAIAAALLLSQPAAAALKTYTLAGDASQLFPTCGTLLDADAVSGTAAIDETGDGSPLLVDLEVVIDQAYELGYVVSSIPGTTVTIESHTVLRPDPSQTGAGDTTSTIHWGTLTGWTQTGWFVCTTHIPGGSPPPSSCVPAVGFEGTGPPPPLASTSFDTDPWTFAPDGFAFDAGSIEYVNLGGGAIQQHATWRGELSVPIPALPLAGIAALAAALTWIGARALRQPRARGAAQPDAPRSASTASAACRAETSAPSQPGSIR